jgi:ribosomal protein S19
VLDGPLFGYTITIHDGMGDGLPVYLNLAFVGLYLAKFPISRLPAWHVEKVAARGKKTLQG